MFGGGTLDFEYSESRNPDDGKEENGNEREQNLRFSGTAEKAMN